MVQEKPLTVTACLITWKRQHNISKIVDSLIRYPFISEIIIRDHSKLENLKCYGRYVSAQKASNDIIYTQDDDCIISGVEEIYEKFIKEPEKISHGGIWEYERVIKDNIYGDNHMAMFGWGAFFNKKWIPVLKKYTEKYGADYCFYRETDRIFSLLKGGHHNFTQVKVEHLGATDENAMANESDHIKYKKLAIERALELAD